MTRITHVKRARKNVGHCGKCSAGIRRGDPYYWLSFRFGGKRIRCAKPGCKFMRSDTTQSKLSTVYAAQEHAEELLAKWDGKDAEALGVIVSDTAEQIREVLGEYEDQANEHPNLASSTEDIRSELESICDELEGHEVEERNEGETAEAWAERVRDEATAAIDTISNV